ncbi:MAG: metallophosphoesterase family protein, partial [Myxococcota bacterium]
FEQYHVDIVFSGHDHCYERSTVNGVKYVVTGGGGAPLYGVNGDWWTEVSDSVHHDCVLDIEGARTVFTAKRLDGSTLDSFVLGEDVGECAVPSDCDGRVHGDCEADELGAWACVQTGCIWNCEPQQPPQPDAGAGGAGGTGGAAGAAGTSGGGGSVLHDADIDATSGSGGGTGTSKAGPSEEDGSGCACRQAGGSSGLWPALIALLATALRSARRRRKRGC